MLVFSSSQNRIYILDSINLWVALLLVCCCSCTSCPTLTHRFSHCCCCFGTVWTSLNIGCTYLAALQQITAINHLVSRCNNKQPPSQSMWWEKQRQGGRRREKLMLLFSADSLIAFCCTPPTPSTTNATRYATTISTQRSQSLNIESRTKQTDGQKLIDCNSIRCNNKTEQNSINYFACRKWQISPSHPKMHCSTSSVRLLITMIIIILKCHRAFAILNLSI